LRRHSGNAGFRLFPAGGFDREGHALRISTHLFGIPRTRKSAEMCARAGAFAVEDAAQAMGGSREGKKLGTLGDVGFFSLGRGKNITCGSGGVVITSSDEIAAAVRDQYDAAEEVPPSANLKNLLEIVFMMVFLRPRLFWYRTAPVPETGGNAFPCVIPRAQVHRVPGGGAGRAGPRAGAAEPGPGPAWRSLPETPGAGRKDADLLRGVPLQPFPLFAADRGTKEAICVECDGLGSLPCILRPSTGSRSCGMLRRAGVPGADRVSDTLVTLPTHVLLDERDFERIGERVAGYGSNLREAPCT
jgi:hypothetical protein